MRLKRLLVPLVAVIALTAGDCVSRAEFEAHVQEYHGWRDTVTANGAALNIWLDSAQNWFEWLNDNQDVWCPDCDPPGSPPPPPPPGDWG